MRILFVWPAVEMSVWDVARGYQRALVAAGHDVRDYFLHKRLAYHQKAFGPPPDDKAEAQRKMRAISELASETVVVEALRHRADLVIVVSGLCLHACALQLLRAQGFRTAVLLTESPYEDFDQHEWLTANPEAVVFTNDSLSAKLFGWEFLPHAVDPAYHRPVPPDESEACDVLMVGSGWPDRVKLLSEVDWAGHGIRLRLLGIWLSVMDDPQHPLRPYCEPNLVVDNEHIAPLYCSAKICLNFHRAHPTAESLGPRVREVAACGAFQLSDPRRELADVFGDTVPTFTSASELESLVLHYLARPEEREAKARAALARVARETFDARLERLLAAIPAPVHAVGV